MADTKPPDVEYAVNKAFEEKDYPTANKLMDIQVSGMPGGLPKKQPYRNVRHKRTYDRRTGRKR
jgi:uncharacterized protein (UPF0297 family)